MINFPPDGPGGKGETASADVKVADDKVKDVKVEDRKVKGEGGVLESLPRTERRRKDVQVAAVSGRRLPAAEPPKGGGSTPEPMSTPSAASTLVQNTRLLAKEQLVYALRFTGAKLKDVQEKASRQ